MTYSDAMSAEAYCICEALKQVKTATALRVIGEIAALTYYGGSSHTRVVLQYYDEAVYRTAADNSEFVQSHLQKLEEQESLPVHKALQSFLPIVSALEVVHGFTRPRSELQAQEHAAALSPLIACITERSLFYGRGPLQITLGILQSLNEVAGTMDAELEARLSRKFDDQMDDFAGQRGLPPVLPPNTISLDAVRSQRLAENGRQGRGGDGAA